MKLLVDANIAPLVAARLRYAGHEAVHVIEIDMHRASDVEIIERALTDGSTVVSSDTDFAAILAARNTPKPSFVLLRHVNELTPERQAQPLIEKLACWSQISSPVPLPSRPRHNPAAEPPARRVVMARSAAATRAANCRRSART